VAGKRKTSKSQNKGSSRNKSNSSSKSGNGKCAGNNKRKSTAPRPRYRDEEHRQEVLARRRQLEKERYWEDPDYRRRKLDEHRAYRAARAEETNAKLRKRYATDPDYRERRLAYDRKRRLKQHGLSDADYQALLLRQGGVCGICKRKPGKRRLCVDHDHETGQVRGLLCGRCNSGLGFYGDDARLTRRAAAYLEAARGGAPARSAAPGERRRACAGSPKPRSRAGKTGRARVAQPAGRTRAGRARRVRRTVSPFGPRPDSEKGPGRGHHRGQVRAVVSHWESARGSRGRA
jgi:hypothetical protein